MIPHVCRRSTEVDVRGRERERADLVLTFDQCWPVFCVRVEGKSVRAAPAEKRKAPTFGLGIQDIQLDLVPEQKQAH